MNAVEAHDLKYAYGSKTAVAGVSFDVKQGEWFALLGPKGAGKTTTLHMLATMLRPASGRATVMGADTVTEARKARAQLGMVFQTPALDLRLTAWENLRLHSILYGLHGRELKRGLSIVMTTHYLPEADVCDRIGIIDHGRLVALGSPTQLRLDVLGRPGGDLEEVFFGLTGRDLSRMNEPLDEVSLHRAPKEYR